MKANTRDSRRIKMPACIITVLFTISFLTVTAQVKQPYGWYRADLPGPVLSGWNNYAATVTPLPSFSGQAMSSKCLLNYNDAFLLNNTHPGFSFDVDSISNSATLMIVYQSDAMTLKKGLWRLKLPDDKSLQLTNRSLMHLKHKVSYSDSTFLGPLLNASFLSWPKQSADSVTITFSRTEIQSFFR